MSDRHSPISPLRLSAENFDETGARVAITSDGWISNGHWAVEPNTVVNRALFASDELVLAFLGRDVYRPEFTAAAMMRRGTGVRFHWTPWLLQGSGQAVGRLFLAPTREHVVLSQKYLRLFGVDEPGWAIRGHAHDAPVAFYDGDKQVLLIMPLRIEAPNKKGFKEVVSLSLDWLIESAELAAVGEESRP
jgi:hypothetical protein